MAEESQQQRYCRQCGTQIRSNTLFCIHCGARLGDPGSSTSLERQETTNFEFGGQQAGTAFTNPWQWFKEQSQARKISVILAIMVPLVVLSPLTFILGVILIALCICWIVISAINRSPWQGWAIAAVVGIIPTLMFGGLSNAMYGTGFTLGGSGSYEGSSESVSSQNNSNTEDPYEYSVSSSTESVTPQDPAEAFMSAVEDDPTLNTLPQYEAMVWNLGSLTCGGYDIYGWDRDDIYNSLYQDTPPEYGQEEILSIMVLATMYRCPEHLEELQSG